MDEELIPLSRPDIGAAELERVSQVLLSGRLSLGPACREFEQRLASLSGTRYAVVVSSGTAALHLIVRALGVGRGDEIITTPYSFVASANAALFENASPAFVDVEPASLNIDVARIEERITPRTRAILAVDIFGIPANWPALAEIAEKHGLALIDDGCEALGASVGGRPIGAWADATAFGFYPNKQITTGEGGCITTDDAQLAAACRSMANQGRGDRHLMHHVRLGYNYRMDEMSAALGCAQLDRLDELQSKRERVATAYAEHLEPLGDTLTVPVPRPGATRSWFTYVVRLSDDFTAAARDDLQRFLRSRGIESSPYFPAIHLQPLYRDRGHREGDFPVAETASARTLALPFFTQLSEDQIRRVARAVTEAVPSLPRTRKSFAQAS